MKNNKKLIFIMTTFILVFVVAFIVYKSKFKEKGEELIKDQISSSSAEISSSESSSVSKEVFPYMDFKMTDNDGNEIEFSQIVAQGKPIILNFWASWCGPCVYEMPEFQSFYDANKDDINFVMLNQTDGQRETLETAKKFIADNEYAFPVYFDIEQDAANKYFIRALPTTFFFDAEGNIVANVTASIDEELLELAKEKMFPEEDEEQS